MGAAPPEDDADEAEPPGEEREDDPPLGSPCRASASSTLSFSFALGARRLFPALELMVMGYQGQQCALHFREDRNWPRMSWRFAFLLCRTYPCVFHHRPKVDLNNPLTISVVILSENRVVESGTASWVNM